MTELLKNALESIRMGIEDFNVGGPRTLSAARNLNAGILLLYKEKLRRLSPDDSNAALMMSRVKPHLDQDGSVVWKGDGKKTADRQQVQERLSGLGISVDWKSFDRVAKLRNEIEHHHPQQPPKTIKEVVATSFVLIRDFLTLQLDMDPLESLGDEPWSRMLSISEVFKKEHAECQTRLAAVAWPTESAAGLIRDLLCEECESSLLEPLAKDADEIRCRACGFKMTVSRLLEVALDGVYGGQNYRAAKQGAEPETEECPECWSVTFVMSEYKCIACGYVPQHTSCGRCHSSISLDEQEFGGLCSYCHHLMTKDD